MELYKMKAVLVIGAGMLLTACGGGSGGGGGTSPAASATTGTFVDSPVDGLHYTTTSNPVGGFTSGGGHFQCQLGDTVTFFIGTRQIGNAQPCSSDAVTVVSVLGATSVTDPQVVNLAQLLMTLDSKATSGVITIPQPLPAGFNSALVLAFTDPNFDTAVQAALPAGTTLVTNAAATAQLQSSLKTLTVTIVNGGTVTSTPAGINCIAGAGTCSSVVQAGTVVGLTATGTGFTGWSGGGCSGTSTCVVTLNADTPVTATFPVAPPPASLTISTTGTGTGIVTCSANGGAFAACAASYPNGTALVLQGGGNAGSTFTGWGNGTGSVICTGTANCSVTLNANSTVTATFVLNAVTQFSVTANTASANGGGGSVVCSANGGAAGPCGSYPVGTPISISPTPNAASNFTVWTNGTGSVTANCSNATGACTFTLTANTSITANFNQPALTVVVAGTGTVNSNPTGINNCTGTCTASFNKGTSVTLTDSGAGFGGWNGGGCSGAGTCVVTLNQNTSITATFGAVSGSSRYHFFMNTGGPLGNQLIGPLMAVDPAAPAATPATVAAVASNSTSLSSGTWDAATTSFSSLQPVFQVYGSNSKLWRVNVATSSGVPGSATNPPIQISSESAAVQICTFDPVVDVTNSNTRRVFYELAGADGQCGFNGQGGTNADNITKFVSIADGPSVAPIVLPTGLSLPPHSNLRFVYNLSTGIATHMFLINAANSNTLSVMNLSTQAITPIQANIADISIAVHDTSDRVFLSSVATKTLYVYTVSSNTLVPLITGGSSDGLISSDGTQFFVVNPTAGIVYRIPLTATAAGQVTTILNVGGQIGNYAVTTNRVYATVPVGTPLPTATKIISVPKSGGASREDVPAVAGNVIQPILESSNGLFWYTSVTYSANFQTVTSSTTVALNESGTPAASFANTGQAGFITSSGPVNVRGPNDHFLKTVLVSTYVGGVLNGGTMTAVDAATGAATTTVGIVPSTGANLTNLTFVNDKGDNAALGIGIFPASGKLGMFFLDSATPNSLVQVPVALGFWAPVP